MDNIQETIEFVKQKFIKHPHYSFNHRSVMFNHSITVKNICIDIYEKLKSKIKIDKEVLCISALLHDIGKTYISDSQEFLLKKHASLNIVISWDFVDWLDMSESQKEKIKEIISENRNHIEWKIIYDADGLGMYKDKTLHMLYVERACNDKLYWEISKKINKYNKMFFDESREIGKIRYDDFKQNRKEYLNKEWIKIDWL